LALVAVQDVLLKQQRHEQFRCAQEKPPGWISDSHIFSKGNIFALFLTDSAAGMPHCSAIKFC